MRDDLGEVRPSTETGSTAGAVQSRSRARWVLRRIYTANPFYVISADLVFLGLRASFDPHARVFDTWALVGGLAAYTLLLAATAVALVRRLGVWDDARTILLLVVLMFLAASVTLDDVLIFRPGLGAACFVGGLVFAVAVSEAMLRGMRLRLPAGYRLPYYALLAGFFLYPIALRPSLAEPDRPGTYWALFGFGPTMAGLFLTLLPAVRRGRAYVAGNGSPWAWPLYPWTLFGLLGLAAGARSFYLCVSLHNVEGFRSVFGPYFLIPLGLAGCALLLEAGLVGRRPWMVRLSLAGPILLAGLGLVGHQADAVYRRSLATFEAGAGGMPAFAALAAAGLFLAYAAARRAPGAWDASTAVLAALAVVGPGTVDLDGLVAPRPLPLLAAVILQGWLAAARGESWRAGLAIGAATAGSWLGAVPGPLEGHRAALALNIALGGAMLAGAAFDDGVGRLLRRFGALLLLWLGAAAATGDPRLDLGLSADAARGYAAGLGTIAVAYGLAVGDRVYLQAAAAGLAGLAALTGWRGYVELRRAVRGLDQIAWGLASFALAAVVSLGKAGVLADWLGRLRARLGPRVDPLADPVDGP